MRFACVLRAIHAGVPLHETTLADTQMVPCPAKAGGSPTTCSLSRRRLAQGPYPRARRGDDAAANTPCAQGARAVAGNLRFAEATVHDRTGAISISLDDGRRRTDRGNTFGHPSLRAGHRTKVGNLARRKGFEPLTPRFEVWCSIQLSYRRLPSGVLLKRFQAKWKPVRRPETRKIIKRWRDSARGAARVERRKRTRTNARHRAGRLTCRPCISSRRS